MERAAKYIVILAHEGPDPMRLNFAKCDFFQSVFFYHMFAYTLLAWHSIALLTALRAYKTFGKKSKKGIQML